MPTLRVSKSDGYAVKSPINPSLYTLLFDRSPILNSPTTSPLGALNLPSFGNFPGSHAAWKQAVRELNQRMAGNSSFIPINEKYLDKIDPEDRHWLPTDIHVNGDGTINILSYINNLHPGKYADAYKSIATMISRCIPALEQVLTDLKNLRDLRVPYDLETSVQEDIPHPTEYCYSYSRDPESDYEEAEEMWEDGLTKTTPLPDGFKRPKRTYLPRSLRNTSLQVVVKMEDMFANPTSERGYDADWHGDGTASEQIIATAVYFYDVDDDSDISLRFREGISAIDIRSRIRRERVMHMFVPSYAGLSESHHEQIVGDVKIRQGQVVCYPNVYQHCISGLYPKDPSKPCHIKSLTLHFVDPSIRIVSTSVVPPQQKEWWASEVLQTPLMRRLPSLMHEKIIESVDMPMSLDQASAIGLDLDKRSFKVDNNFYNGRFYMSLDNDLDSNHVDFF
ncbi:hypothetical protein LPJ53_002004 [Coemansia erecta]|uniref:DUF4246 domain-containing protein n=1 Tax=Coemansia erecta TaxID=147472 RepID=A0A9W8CUA6_9FUNG|nr:hypothetical protein LPJ53_002004 [Coemansia erecta]